MPAIPEEGAEFESPPLGTHMAVCTEIVDLGTQPQSFGGDNWDAHQIVMFWELTEERTSGGHPFRVLRYYTWSMSTKSNLRKDLESWRSKPFTKEEFGKFDIKNVLGAHCQVIIGTGDNGKVKVTGVAGWPKGVPKPKPSVTPSMVWLSAAEFDTEAYEALSEYWRSKIKGSPEYVALTAPKSSVNGSHAPLGAPLSAELSDEIPF